LLFRDKLRARRRNLLPLILCDFRIVEIELLNCLDNRRRDDKAGEPLVVGGHHEPGCIPRRRSADRLGPHPVASARAAQQPDRPGHRRVYGRVVKRTGEGSIIEFRSAVDKVRCAIEVQTGLIERNAGLTVEMASSSGPAFACGLPLC
jgi:hypothetical protein